MKIGDLVTWKWWGINWQKAYRGIIIDSKLVKTDREKIVLYTVLDNLGSITELREDTPELVKIEEL
tara:strand:- start:2512 stop:2709 length:198 start_codon:yes stop_codon:yes gene_type:complete